MIVSILVVLILAGLALWVASQLPIDATIYRIIRVVVIVVVVIWLLLQLMNWLPGRLP